MQLKIHGSHKDTDKHLADKSDFVWHVGPYKKIKTKKDHHPYT